MYEKHFGLSSRPFGPSAEGTQVFLGPRQSKIISGLQSGLTTTEAVLTVTGPVGVGKTTILNRALESLSPGRVAARIGRMQLQPDEAVDLLMAGFGIKQKQSGSIRRFAAFRRLLQAQAAKGVPVAVIIEDALRIGVDALAEIEALTAPDTGDAASANIILMGQPELNELLATPELARLKQRVRRRESVEPYSQAETRGYLKHCLRNSGGDYDAIFDEGAAEIIADCSEGIPRVINTICEAALNAAAEDQSARVTKARMLQIAVDGFGFDAAVSSIPVVEEISAPHDQDAVDEQAQSDVPQETKAVEEFAEPITNALDEAPETPAIGHDIVVESGSYPAKNADESDSSIIKIGAATESDIESSRTEVPMSAETDAEEERIAEEDIPDLINDTQPELRQLPDPEKESEVADDEASTASDEISTQETAAAGDAIPDVQSVAEEHIATDADTDANIEPDVDKDTADAIADEPKVATNLDRFSQNVPGVLVTDDQKTDPSADLTSDSDVAVSTDSVSIAADTDESSSDLDAAPEPDMDLPTLSDSMRVSVTNDSEGDSEGEELDTSALEDLDLEALAASYDEPLANDQALDSPATNDTDLTPYSESILESTGTHQVPKTTAPTELEVFGDLDQTPAPMTDNIASASALDVAEPLALAESGTFSTPELSLVDTMEQKVQNIDALEEALEAAKQDETTATTLDSNSLPSAEENAPDAETFDNELPEITLDEVLADKQAQVAEEISAASSLEDMSEEMAATLFGSEELNQLAAEAAMGSVATGGTEDSNETVKPKSEPSPVKLETVDSPAAANDEVEKVTELQLERAEPAKPTSPPTAEVPNAKSADHSDIPLNESVAMRIDILNKMKSNVEKMASENVEMGVAEEKPANPAEEQPDNIENQINTSITQTLKALKVPEAADAISEECDDDDGDEKEEKKSGFFSRFKKSS